MPALRERRDDIPLLIQHFLDKVCKEKGLATRQLTDTAHDRICRHTWPGNVRELENLVERLVVLSRDGRIDVPDLPRALQEASPPATAPQPPLPEEGLSFPDEVDRFETDLIQRALERTHWNKNQAARLLGLNRTTLIEKIKKKGLSPDS
jgi:DNA-binding NtrC family response regulator